MWRLFFFSPPSVDILKEGAPGPGPLLFLSDKQSQAEAGLLLRFDKASRAINVSTIQASDLQDSQLRVGQLGSEAWESAFSNQTHPTKPEMENAPKHRGA